MLRSLPELRLERVLCELVALDRVERLEKLERLDSCAVLRLWLELEGIV